MIIHGISPGPNFVRKVYVPNSMSVVHIPSGRFWMVGNHPWNVGWPSWRWWLTIPTSPGLNFVSYVQVPNFKSVVHFLLVDFGLWVTFHGMVGDPLGDGG